MKIFIALFISLVGLSTNVVAKGHEPVVNEFFQKIADGKYEKAVVEALLGAYNEAGVNATYEQVKSQVGALSSQFEQVGNAFGESHGYEAVVERSLGSRYKRVKYVLYYNAKPVEVTLSLYAPKGNWQIYNINLNTEIAEELKTHVNGLYQ